MLSAEIMYVLADKQGIFEYFKVLFIYPGEVFLIDY